MSKEIKGEIMIKRKPHYKSMFSDEQELLRALLEIHNDGNMIIDIDPMYNKGKFYKDGTVDCDTAFDMNPLGKLINDGWRHIYETNGRTVYQGDATKLSESYHPKAHGTMNSIILDPPFMWRKMKKSTSAIGDRYTMFETWEQLETMYKGIIRESYKMLKKNGLLIFKCQDYTNSKTTMVHVYVHQWLEQAGFYVKDLAILNKPNKPANYNLKQRHLRKTHTYFWVAVKKGK